MTTEEQFHDDRRAGSMMIEEIACQEDNYRRFHRPRTIPFEWTVFEQVI